MSRTERLLDLVQILRRHRRPVSGRVLADELGISLRTLYRDISTLQGQGAPLEGEAGIGYVLKPGFMLPPLMFSEDEIEALVLGSRWVADRADGRLGAAARDALAKIAAVLPGDLRADLDHMGLLVAPGEPIADTSIDLGAVRDAIRGEFKLAIDYRDANGVATRRVIWPVALGFFDKLRVVVAWCELRDGFRHFRADRISGMAVMGERYPVRRRVLVRQWRDQEGLLPPV